MLRLPNRWLCAASPPIRSLFVAALALLVGCGDDSPTQPPLPPGAAIFAIRACRDATRPGEVFRVLLDDPALIAEATALVGAGEEKIVSGRVVRGDGAFNRGWSWHLDPDSVRFVDLTIEVCDGCPSYLEAHLDEWLEQVGQYCPWSTEVLARER